MSTLASASAGRIINWAGDGCFLTFETPSAAVTFALRQQQAHSEEPDLSFALAHRALGGMAPDVDRRLSAAPRKAGLEWG